MILADPEQRKEDLCDVPGKGDSKCKRQELAAAEGWKTGPRGSKENK